MDTQEQLKLVTKELEDKTFQRNLQEISPG